MRSLASILFVVGTLLIPGAAWAQAPKASTTDKKIGDQLEKDLEQKWGRTRAVQVVQDRLFPKVKRLELDVFLGVLPNDAFLVYLTPGLRLAYHINEQWSVELGGSYSAGVDTGLRAYLEDADSLVQARLRDQVLGRFGAAAVWSPVYGKFAAGRTKLAHFDLYFLFELGGVYVQGEEILDLKGGIWPEVGIGIGLRFFITKLVNLRFEYRQRLAIREGLADDPIRLSYPSEISLGFSFLIDVAGGGKK